MFGLGIGLTSLPVLHRRRAAPGGGGEEPPPGMSWLVDQNGNRITDENGNSLFVEHK